MPKYKLYCNTAIYEVNEAETVLKVIPIAEDCPDYQIYLEWLSEGNTPLPVD